MATSVLYWEVPRLKNSCTQTVTLLLIAVSSDQLLSGHERHASCCDQFAIQWHVRCLSYRSWISACHHCLNFHQRGSRERHKQERIHTTPFYRSTGLSSEIANIQESLWQWQVRLVHTAWKTTRDACKAMEVTRFCRLYSHLLSSSCKTSILSRIWSIHRLIISEVPFHNTSAGDSFDRKGWLDCCICLYVSEYNTIISRRVYWWQCSTPKHIHNTTIKPPFTVKQISCTCIMKKWGWKVSTFPKNYKSSLCYEPQSSWKSASKHRMGEALKIYYFIGKHCTCRLGQKKAVHNVEGSAKWGSTAQHCILAWQGVYSIHRRLHNIWVEMPGCTST